MFLSHLFEAIDKRHAAFCFGRMNPPTIGHEQLIKTVGREANGGDYYIFTSQTQDSKKNPLDYQTKVRFLRALYPGMASHFVYEPGLKTIMQVAEWLYKKGYRNVTFVAGSDRLPDFEELLNKYNGAEGGNVYYKFDTIRFASSGERDPDSEGVAGVSASAAREAAKAGNFEAFSQAVDAGALTQQMYDAVRKGLGVTDNVNESDELQIQNKKINSFLSAVENWWNNKVENDQRITYKGPGMRVWTRGDGTRSRDPAKIYGVRFTTAINPLWDALAKLPGAKPAGTVSGEFGSSPHGEAIAYKGFILVKRESSIDVMSRSRVTNPNSVWRQKSVDEGTFTNSEVRQMPGSGRGSEGYSFTPNYKVGSRVTVKGYQGAGFIAFIKHRGDVGVKLDDGTRVKTTIDDLRPSELRECSGYIPKNKKEAKDPRWSNALTVDVKPDTPTKNAKALRLA